MDIQPHQQRVVDELKELDDRRTKLAAFISMGSPKYSSLSKVEQDLLIRQLHTMNDYRHILVLRLSLWGIETP